MNKNRNHSLFLLTFLLFSLSAQASLQYISDDRYMYHSGISRNAGYATPDTDFQDWSDSWFAYDAYASQNSYLSEYGMNGNGGASLYPTDYWMSADSTFDVTFTVDQTTDFSLNVNFVLNLEEYSYAWGEENNAYAMLYQNGDVMADFQFADGDSFDYQGILSTGTSYRLEVFASNSGLENASRGWEFALTTSEVPLPAGFWLFGSALLGLAGYKKRQRCLN